MNFIKENWGKFVLSFYFLLTPLFIIYADIGGPVDPSDGVINNPIPNVTSVPGLIQTILEGALKVGIPIVALAVIYVGFLFVSARGNEAKLTEAKDAFLYTIIGAAILLGAWSIAKMISATVLAL